MVELGANTLVWLEHIVQGLAYSGFAVQIWEWAALIPDEVQLFTSGRKNIVIYLYAWCRYAPLIAHLSVLILTHFSWKAPSPQICGAILILKTTSGQLAMTCLEVILLIRVHAFYNRCQKLLYVLGAVIFSGFVIEVTGTIMALRSAYKYGFTCLPGQCSKTALAVFGIGAVVNHGTVFLLTLWKAIVGSKYGWGKTPLTGLMLRDGLFIFLILSITISTIISYEIAKSLNFFLWNAAFAWYITLVSILGCRLIINMRTLAISHVQGANRTDPLFTSVFFSEESNSQCLPSFPSRESVP